MLDPASFVNSVCLQVAAPSGRALLRAARRSAALARVGGVGPNRFPRQGRAGRGERTRLQILFTSIM